MQPPKLKFKNINKSTSENNTGKSKKNSDNNKTLYIYFNHKGKEYCYSSKLEINPKWWHFKNHRLNSLSKKALGVSEYERYMKIIGEKYQDFNDRLNKFENVVVDTITKNELNNISFDIKSLLINTFNKIVKNKVEEDKRYEVYLLDLMLKLKKDKKFYTVFSKSQNFASKTISGHFTVINYIIRFLEEKDKYYKTADYSTNFINEFTEWLLSITELDNSSINSYFNRIDSLIRKANSAFKLNIDFESIVRPKYRIELCDYQALNLDEIKTLLLLRLETHYSKETRYKKKEVDAYINESDVIIRDLFVLGCFTGLRFSDLSNISDNDIIKDGNNIFISKLTQKTKVRVKIPLTKPAIKIIEKYGGKFPKLKIGAQMFNIRIKNIIKASGIIDEIEYFDGVKTTKDFKYNLISSHTMRRSFASIMYFEVTMQPKQIMKFTGHKNLATFEKYLRISENQDISVFNDPKFDEI